MLKRNGTYARQVVDEYGFEGTIRIQRLRCRGCNASHSLLYDFLIPYRKYTVRAIGKAARVYLEQPSSYLEALNEVVSESATLFTALESLLRQLPILWMHLLRQAIGAGLGAREFAVLNKCPNSNKCRKSEKQERLDWANQLLTVFPDVLESANAIGFWLFASGRGCELLRTHSPECAVF